MSKKNELILVRHSKEPADDRVFTFARLNRLIPIEKFPFRGDLLANQQEELSEQLYMVVSSAFLKMINILFSKRRPTG